MLRKKKRGLQYKYKMINSDKKGSRYTIKEIREPRYLYKNFEFYFYPSRE